MAGQRTSALVEFVDIYPALCEPGGLPLPPRNAPATRRNPSPISSCWDRARGCDGPKRKRSAAGQEPFRLERAYFILAKKISYVCRRAA